MKYFIRKHTLVLALLVFSFVSCQRDTKLAGPIYNYEVVKPPVFFDGDKASLKDVVEGDIVSFKVRGLKSNLKTAFTFKLNQQEGKIIHYTDSILTVEIPKNASSGPATIETEDGLFFVGPNINVVGKVNLDRAFNVEVGVGTNGPIYEVLSAPNSRWILVGSFTDYANKKTSARAINGIVKINGNGRIDEGFNAKKGVEGGVLYNIASLDANTNKIIIAGRFASYDGRSVANITKINGNGTIDSIIRPMINMNDGRPQDDFDTVPIFNGYLSGSPVKTFVESSGKIITIANSMRNWSRIFYDRAQKNLKQHDNTRLSHFVRYTNEGALDSTFNFDIVKGVGISTLNGSINTAIKQSNGNIVFAGSFTNFNNVAANRIAFLNANGGVDAANTANLGSGANNVIYNLSYNANTNKMLAVGDFTAFNEHPSTYIALLNADGSVRTDFITRKFEGGKPTSAYQLNNGKILVFGNFLKYDNIVRPGFMIINPDGSLAEGYNNIGAFLGNVMGIREFTHASGKIAVLVYGSFGVFNAKKAGNLVQLLLEND